MFRLPFLPARRTTSGERLSVYIAHIPTAGPITDCLICQVFEHNETFVTR